MVQTALDKRAGSREKRRLQFEFSGSAYEGLVALKERTGANSFAEVVRDALRLYKWYLTKKEEGYELALLRGNDKGQKDVIEVELLL